MFNFKLALINLKSTKLRSLLAMLGIVVGSGSVVAMVSIGQMAADAALAQFKTLGTDLFAVSLYTASDSNKTSGKKFKLEQALALKNASLAIKTVAPYIITSTAISYRGNSIDSSIIGTTSELADVIRIKTDKGRFISPLDHYEKYCFIGKHIYEELKKFNPEPLHSLIRLGDSLFTIIGVANNWPENAFFYQDINSAIIIPLQTARFISPSAEINDIIMRLHPEADIPQVKTDIEIFLQKEATDKKFFLRSAKELVKSMAEQHRIFTILLGLIGGISLIVGGIGVMNIMLVSVLERRREIGIRLAVGAKSKEIQWMFLSEAVLLSLIGGAAGCLVGIMVAGLVALFAGWHFVIYFLPLLIGFTVSGLTGIFFGFYPAYKAARLNPIQVLRID